MPSRFRYKRKAVKRVRRRTVRKAAPSKKMVSMVKNIVRHTALEPKRYTVFSNNIANVIHRDFYYFTPIFNIAVGTGDQNRTGSEIYVNSIQMKLMVNRKATFFDDIRIMVYAFWQPRNETDWSELANSGWTGSGALRTQFFENEGSGIETVNYAEYGIRPIFRKQIVLKANNWGSTVSQTARQAVPYILNIPCKMPFKWRSQGTTTTPIRQFFIAMYAYGGGLVTSDLNTLYDLTNSVVINFRDV